MCRSSMVELPPPLVSDYLKVRGWHVNHIIGEGKFMEHPYTKPARVVEDRLAYEK